MIGTITIWTIEMNMSAGLKWIWLPINSNVIIGVNIGEITVETAVKETDNATSPFARKVMTSDAVPPGTVPTRMSPTVKAVSRENALARANAMIGIIMYCAEIPTAIALGFLTTLMKSSVFNVVPIVKRTMLKSKLRILMPLYSLKTHLKEFG